MRKTFSITCAILDLLPASANCQNCCRFYWNLTLVSKRCACFFSFFGGEWNLNGCSKKSSNFFHYSLWNRFFRPYRIKKVTILRLLILEGEKISILLKFEFIVRLRTKTSFAQGKGVKTLSKTETISSERPLLHPPRTEYRRKIPNWAYGAYWAVDDQRKVDIIYRWPPSTSILPPLQV